MRGEGVFDPRAGFGEAYRRFYDLDLGQRFRTVPWRQGQLATQVFRPTAGAGNGAVPSPRGDAAGTALVVHGYYDHVGLYGHLIRHLIARGLTVLAYDQPGHGLSSGERATIASFDAYVEALDAVLAAHGDGLPQPLVALGQSMGGAVLMERLMRPAPAAFAATVLFAPLVRPKGWAWARVALPLARPFLKDIRRGAPRNTEDEAFLAFLRKDPLQAWTLPLQWATAMAAWMQRFEAYPSTRRRVIVIQGGRDGTVDAPHNLAVLRRLFDIDVLEIPAARHHLVNETEAVRERIWAFLDERLWRHA